MNFHKRILVPALLLVLLAGCGGNGGGGSSENSDQNTGNNTPPGNPLGTPATVVLAANDLGMHCMDREFSVFSILPPFNVVNARVLHRSATGLPELLDETRVDVRYGGVADADGSINTYSASGPLTKTDFWNHADRLFGTSLLNGQGLTGLTMPGDDPLNCGDLPMTYDPEMPRPRPWPFRVRGLPKTATPCSASARATAQT